MLEVNAGGLLLLSTLAFGTGSLSELGAHRLKGPPAFAF